MWHVSLHRLHTCSMGMHSCWSCDWQTVLTGESSSAKHACAKRAQAKGTLPQHLHAGTMRWSR